MRTHLAKLPICALRGHVARRPPNDGGGGRGEPSRVVLITYATGEQYGLCCCERCGLGFWDVRPRPAP